MSNKKILIFTDYFLPGSRAGGPVTSIANLSTLLKNDFEIIIVTSNKDLGLNAPYDNVEFDKKIMYENYNMVYLSDINSKTILNTIHKINPDLIYLNSFFSIFTQLVLFQTMKNRLKIPIVLAPRGELQENALLIKKWKKKVYLTIYKFMKLYKIVYFHATDIIEFNRIKKMFSTDDISVISNMPKIGNGIPLSKEKDELKLIFISRIRDNKNLLLALNTLSKCKGKIVFDIYGPIEDSKYWEKCQSVMHKLPQNIVSKYKGIVTPIKISNVMREYHALLLPTKTENFGHVIVEAMQSGVIPIISDQTPWRNLEQNSVGWDLSLEDEHKFTKVISDLYEMDKDKYILLSKNSIKYVKSKLKTNELKENYIKLFNMAIDYKLRPLNNYTKNDDKL